MTVRDNLRKIFPTVASPAAVFRGMRRASTAPDFVGGTHNKPRASRLISLPSRAMGVSEGDAGSGGDTGWDALGLDPRWLRALTKKRYRAPTPVQARAIPLVLAGKDVVARAHTGSGKTAAYLLPAIHKIMQSDVSGAPAPNPRALVLVPTRELSLIHI